MRAVVGCAIGLLLLVLSGRAETLPLPRFGEPASCEEQCRFDRTRDDAACETGMLAETDRRLCHEAVRARLDVCLRICED